ncbi:MAG: PEP-CTERM sorting domain-containing protein [Planctomycetes bacterium]|nr:PEP-CTERM sorting domain-containing protein [Planctomycetota bacterium]
MTSLLPTSHVVNATRPLGWTFRSVALVLAWVGFGTLASGESGDWKDHIGYTQLVGVLGSATPNGNGVPISLVEAGGATPIYFPNTADSDFGAASDPSGTAVVFTDGSGGQSNGSSSHATSMAKNFFGNTSSIAPAANAVTVYDAGGFISNVLRAPNGGTPLPQNFRVQNHSWIGSFAADANNPTTAELNNDRRALRRYDYLIDTYEITALVGLNNNTASLPRLLGQGYNSIAVGRTDGVHSSGLTNLVDYGVGRSKPDLVVPRTTTSAATASASSAATLLHSAVLAGGEDAAKSETMKAILLAGATKEEFPSWSRTTTQPLDDTFGAGELNVYNSYLMIEGGQTVGSTDATGAMVETVSSSGWDYQTVNPGGDLFYNFEVPVGSTAEELSILLAWNVEVTDISPGPAFTGSESLANLDLALYDSSAGFLDTLVDTSTSTVDNVEHIYQTGLGPGTYTLRVSGAPSNPTERDFGLAWRLNTLFDTPSADFDEDGDVDGFDFLTWQRGFNTLLGAPHAIGDANGDGDVDSADAAIFGATFGPAPPPLALSSAVPEPTALAMLIAGMLWLPTRRRRVHLPT